MNGMSQQCLIYDLRKSSSITLPLIGHESAVNSVRFTNRIDDMKKSNIKLSKEPIKTAIDIRKEAQARVSKEKPAFIEQRPPKIELRKPQEVKAPQMMIDIPQIEEDVGVLNDFNQ